MFRRTQARDLAVVVEEKGLCRAAGQGLESESAGAAKGIEDKGIGDAGGSIAGKGAMDQSVEQGLARPVGGRAHSIARRCGRASGP